MKEITSIIKAYTQALQDKKRTALATVVHVEGSSYRRPGARMLVTEDGQMTGAISGGCLEGDALRKAIMAITQGKNKLVTYDTSDESDVNLGAQIGCNGIVHILFEPIDPENEHNPIALLQKINVQRQDAVLGTLFTLDAIYGDQLGTCLLHLKNTTPKGSSLSNVGFSLKEEINAAFHQKASIFCLVDLQEKKWTAFVEYIPAPVSVVIVGAGNDSIPIMDMAAILGWEVTIVDGRHSHATRRRFPLAKEIHVSKAEDILTKITPDARTFFILLTHNYQYDYLVLKQLIHVDNLPYIGALGPKKKLLRMFSDLEKEGVLVSEYQKESIFGPVGLELGAETSEEIALSILAEIKKVLNQTSGISLRDKLDPIHTNKNTQIDYEKTSSEAFLCAVQFPDL